MSTITRRRWLLGAAALPGAVALAGCSTTDPPPPRTTGRSPGRCVDPSEEIPEEDLEVNPPGIYISPHLIEADNRFLPTTLALSPDGRVLAASEAKDRVSLGLEDSCGVILWDARSGRVIRRIDTPVRGTIAWHPDGTRLAIGHGRQIAIVGVDGMLERTLLGHELPEDVPAHISDLTFSPDGSQLASAGTDGTVRLWETDPASCGSGHVLRPGVASYQRLSYSPDGSALAISGARSTGEEDAEGSPEIWDPAVGRRREILAKVSGEIVQATYAADGALVVAAVGPPSLTEIAADGTVTSGPRTESTRVESLASGRGRRVALLDQNHELLLWNRRTGEERRIEVPGDVSSVAWSARAGTLFCLSSSEGVLTYRSSRWHPFDLP